MIPSHSCWNHAFKSDLASLESSSKDRGSAFGLGGKANCAAPCVNSSFCPVQVTHSWYSSPKFECLEKVVFGFTQYRAHIHIYVHISVDKGGKENMYIYIYIHIYIYMYMCICINFEKIKKEKERKKEGEGGRKGAHFFSLPVFQLSTGV